MTELAIDERNDEVLVLLYIREVWDLPSMGVPASTAAFVRGRSARPRHRVEDEIVRDWRTLWAGWTDRWIRRDGFSSQWFDLHGDAGVDMQALHESRAALAPSAEQLRGRARGREYQRVYDRARAGGLERIVVVPVAGRWWESRGQSTLLVSSGVHGEVDALNLALDDAFDVAQRE